MDAKVVDHPEANRYEIHIDGTLAGFAVYRRDGAVLSFTHTEVAPEFEGQGVGSTLAREALTASRVPISAYKIRSSSCLSCTATTSRSSFDDSDMSTARASIHPEK